MGLPDDWVVALGIVESNDNPRAWGDNGKAMGRWQVHPDRLIDEARRRNRWPNSTDDYDTWVYSILMIMFMAEISAHSPVEIAMYWHIGHWVVLDSHCWNASYANKFNAALARVES